MFDFFDDLDYIFSNRALEWNRPFKEKDGYYTMRSKDGNGFIVVFNTLGISKDDIKVSHEISDDKTAVKLNVYGKTKISEIENTYESKYSILISSKGYSEKIEDVKYTVRDGLTIIYVKTNKITEKQQLTQSTKYIEKMDW